MSFRLSGVVFGHQHTQRARCAASGRGREGDVRHFRHSRHFRRFRHVGQRLQRHPEGESAAFAQAAAHVDVAAYPASQAARNFQPQAGAAVAPQP